MFGQPYKYKGPIDNSIVPDRTQCKGKSIVVTGGAQGLGESYVRAFVQAGAFVTFGDINDEKGKSLESELSPENCCFVECDTRSWEDQIRMFDAAISKSPHKSVDIVIANAGVGRGAGDPMMALEDPNSVPTKPSTHIVEINLIGVMYTFKLAVHYFRRCPLNADRDRCFIGIGSIAGIVDNLGSWEYSVSKFGLRGLTRAVRWNAYHQGIRVAYVAPYYIRTAIQSAQTYEKLRSKGIEFATLDSAVNTIMRVSCDKSINGHALVIVPESISKTGYKDAEVDDWTDESHWLYKFQQDVIKVRGDEWS